jgi:hypothetical protein
VLFRAVFQEQSKAGWRVGGSGRYLQMFHFIFQTKVIDRD